ncbi:hypothetical protein CPB97_005945, partial [Podila verticillata]
RKRNTQPLNTGIIAIFKLWYRELLSMEMVTRVLSNPQLDPYQSTSDASAPTGAVAKVKVSNLDGWRFIVEAWDAVKDQSICHCFHHVPIINDVQKKELACLDKDPEVTTTLKASQQNILQQAWVLAAKLVFQETDPETLAEAADEDKDYRSDDAGDHNSS